jgi:hypothetical protein
MEIWKMEFLDGRKRDREIRNIKIICLKIKN